MYPQVPLQPESVAAGVVAVGAAVGPLVTVHPHVPLQLAQLHGRVGALLALVRLLQRVPATERDDHVPAL